MPPREGQGRLEFLDGLRGLSCLYVLLFHVATLKLEGRGEPSAAMRILLAWLNEGRLAVVFFIVLSGFSLMLPIARAGSDTLVGGFGRFLRRRSRRILPPYYAALLLSIAIIVVYNALAVRVGLGNPIDPAALEPGSIISHLLLFHNLSFDWAYRINGPLWSVATEWQIYWLFPLLLLPLRRFAGDGATALIAYVLSSLPFYLLPGDTNFFWACPWFIGSFALGMWGASIAFAPSYQGSWLRTRVPWVTLAFVFFGVTAVLFGAGFAPRLGYPLTDLAVSLLAFSCINACVQRAQDPSRAGSSKLLRVFGSRSLVYLGGFSYSLYLLQHPLIRFTEKIFSRLPLSYDAIVSLHLLLATPFIIVASWVFAEFFEKPFTTGSVLVPSLRRVLRLEARPRVS